MMEFALRTLRNVNRTDSLKRVCSVNSSSPRLIMMLFENRLGCNMCFSGATAKSRII